MVLLRGAEVSAKIKEETTAMMAAYGGMVPQLAIVRVGERPDDMAYERGAIKTMGAFGLKASVYAYPANIGNEEFLAEFKKINEEKVVDGILLLRPLPKGLDEKAAEHMIDPGKDLDGISPENIAKVFAGDESGFAPCTAQAVVETLTAFDIPIAGKRVVVVGRSLVVGKPLSMLLLKENATVTICHTKTVNLEKTCRGAQILIAAAGKARLLDQNSVGPEAVVIDVGINVDENGKLCGDMDFTSLEGTAAMATPVPGGIGPVTTAVLAKHLVKAALCSWEKGERA